MRTSVKIGFACGLLLLSLAAFGGERPTRRYEFWALRVIDGDTIEGRICATVDVHLPDQPMRIPFCITEAVRMEGVDTPELHGKCDAERDAAKRARLFVLATLGGERLQLDGSFLVRGTATVLVTRVGSERDKYGRVLGDVEILGHSLREALIDAGHARRYDGGARKGWCGEPPS